MVDQDGGDFNDKKPKKVLDVSLGSVLFQRGEEGYLGRRGRPGVIEGNYPFSITMK